MARIVFGAGVSHTPVLTLEPDEWHNRSQADYDNPQLNMSDGRFLTYPELEGEVGAVYRDEARYEVYRRKSEAAQAALDRVADDLAAAAPDVVLVVGDDQEELFTAANQPAFAVYHGEALVMSDRYVRKDPPEWIKRMARGYAMDEARSFPAAGGLGRQLIQQLMDRDVDVASVARVADPTLGFGHAFGFVINRLFRGRAIPVLPVLLNTYYPPNVPTSARCLDIGRKIRQSLEAIPDDLTVAVIASGGLSHFIVDEALDQRVLSGLGPAASQDLGAIARGALNSGSSEILNWIMAAGALEGLRLAWTEYQPVYRTPAGTGVGVAFAVWKP